MKTKKIDMTNPIPVLGKIKCGEINIPPKDSKSELPSEDSSQQNDESTGDSTLKNEVSNN